MIWGLMAYLLIGIWFSKRIDVMDSDAKRPSKGVVVHLAIVFLWWMYFVIGLCVLVFKRTSK